VKDRADLPRVTEIRVDDLLALDTGAGILGTGGGGDPRNGRLRLQSILEDDRYPDVIEIVDPTDLDPDATVISVGGMGAPTISQEKLPKGTEELDSLRLVERMSGETVDAIIPGEIGGANSMSPMCIAAMADLPVVDADGMGRAFPELQMDTFFIYGPPPNYAAISDERGNHVAYRNLESAERLEAFARACTVEMGGRSGFAFPIMDGAFVSKYAIDYTVTLAHHLGSRVHESRSRGADPVKTVCEVLDGQELFTGKIIDVYRRNRDGFAKGSVELAELDGDGSLLIEFQNEFLVARDANGEVLAGVPDLICLVDEDTAEPITTGALRYGQRTRVVGVPAPELLTTPAALEVIGPSAFGYEFSYRPLEEA
jgi:uncharacterized protein